MSPGTLKIETSRAAEARSAGLCVDAARASELRRAAARLPSWDLTDRQVCDLELLLNGAFAPLSGYLGRDDYTSVVETMRLADGGLWPIPIVLDLPGERAAGLGKGSRLALRHPEGMVLAVLLIEDLWEPDREAEARRVYGTADRNHPGVRALLDETRAWYAGGALEGLELPPHHSFRSLRHTPGELKARFRERGWSRIVGFQTRNPMHRAHIELTMAAARELDARILIHPAVGRTSPGDVDAWARVRCYEKVLPRFGPDAAMLSLLPLAMRMAGPREALWHALIRKNHGCTHLIVGRDHAGPGKDSRGAPFYDPFAAQRLAVQHASEIGIDIFSSEELVYAPSARHYMRAAEAESCGGAATMSGTELRRRLRSGADLPEWFTYPEVAAELRRWHPPRSEQGYTVLFTGLSGAGKSTLASVLAETLRERDDRPVTLLDGDIVRKHLSSELGFSRQHRNLNVQRIGFVASEITKNRGVALCAPIAPYRETRREVREMIEHQGGFVEVHVATPLEVCESRDRKGLYAKARAGLLKGFTGIDDPYEEPERAELVIDTSHVSVEEAVSLILGHLEREGFLAREARPEQGPRHPETRG